MGRVVDVVAGLLLGAACAGCGGAGVPLCASCSAVLSGAPFGTEPDPAPAGFPPTWTTTAYAGVARRALLAHKEDGRLALARPLGLVLAAAVRAAIEAAGDDPAPSAREAADPPGVWLVPVPSSRAAVRARGHDALLRTARMAATALRSDGVPAGVLPLLRHRRWVADSTGLTSEQRRANLAHSLWVPPALRPMLPIGRVVVVDDVVTTGATLTEAARALAAAGCADVRAATVAATQRRPTLPVAPGGPGARAGPGAHGLAVDPTEVRQG